MRMTDKQIIREALKTRRWSQRRLAVSVGLRGQSNISTSLNSVKTSMRCDTFFAWLDAMGFEVIVRDKMGTGDAFLLSFDARGNDYPDKTNS